MLNAGGVIGILVFLAIIVVVVYSWWPTSSPCPPRIHRNVDGSLRLEPSGQTFSDMNEFQQWWHSSGINASCPLPALTGAKEVDVMDAQGWPNEQTYAKTPLYKVDDYEFARIFGNERNGHLVLPRQNYNVIIEDRLFDWTNKPLTSDERRGKYRGLEEGFSADGELRTLEAAQRYGAKEDGDDDAKCKSDKEDREVKKLVDRAYGADSEYEPVITKVGPNHWEVTELKPKRRHVDYSDPVDNRVVNTDDDSVDIKIRYREQADVRAAIDPYFPVEGELPWRSERLMAADPFAGPVPNMDRMFGPTFDTQDWTYGAGGV